MTEMTGMDQSGSTPPYPRGRAAELVVDLQRWIREVDEWGWPHFGELGNRLQFYRSALEAEFAAEESQGLLSSVSQRHPECREEIGELRRQHGQFLDELDAMITKLRQDEPPYDSWQEAVRQFDELLTEIYRHDGREQQLLASVTGNASA